jgi:N-acetyl-beta-hexosaminidase
MKHIPAIIPRLREWTGLGNTLSLSESCRLVIDQPSSDELAETADTLQELLFAETGQRLPIVTGSLADKGDIFLVLNKNDREPGDQGYLIEIDELVRLQARSATGIFYGGQTLLQMLHSDLVHARLPRGLAHDSPGFLQRGLMLDAGRRYWEMDSLYKIVRRMARLKMNILHLHLSDWSDFRLQSDRFPGLTANRAYSKLEIASLQSYARRWHVTIVPEIDLPAHATAITRYNPALAFTSDAMSKPKWPGGEYGGFTLDYTNPNVRQWIKDLLSEFIPLFDGPYFHIGSDEVASPEIPSQCSALFEYARTRNYPFIGDVLVEWINEMNAFIKSYGKHMQIWNWWERSPHSFDPDQDITIDVWVDSADPRPFLEAGYPVVNSPENLLYLTPGINLFPDSSHLYKEWTPIVHPNLQGYKLCVWADKCENEPDEYFVSLMCQPQAVLAERTWNPDIPSGNLDDFLNLAKRVGDQMDDNLQETV